MDVKVLLLFYFSTTFCLVSTDSSKLVSNTIQTKMCGTLFPDNIVFNNRRVNENYLKLELVYLYEY